MHKDRFSVVLPGSSEKHLPPANQQQVQIGNTITSFNRCTSALSPVDYEQRFGPLNETKPYKHRSIIL